MKTQMIRSLLFALLLLTPAWAHAAGGTCPTGANYLSLSSPQTGGGLGSVTLASLNITSCYYAAANGLDTNTGSSETTPWRHLPGMPNCSSVCATVTPSINVGFILRGGDIYHVNATTSDSTDTPMGGAWVIQSGSNTTTPIYIGVDFTWYSGSAFTRPILTEDNPISTTQPGSCSHAADGINGSTINMGSTTQLYYIDMLETSGNCMSGNGGGLVFKLGTNVIAERIYQHGWSMASTAVGGSDDHVQMGISEAGSSSSGNRKLFVVIDGQDSTFGNVCTNTSCVQTLGGNNTTAATGWTLSDCWDVEYSILRHAGEGLYCGNAALIHDNLIEYLFNPASGHHGNVFETITPDAGVGVTNQLVYNNLIRNTVEGVGFWTQGENFFWFNNVYENDGHFPCDANGVMASPPGTSGSSVVSFNFFQNTTDGTVCGRSGPPNSTTPAWASGSTATFENDQILGASTYSAFFTTSSGNSQTNVDNGGEVYTGSGYALSNDYYPPAGGSTVGAGNNLASGLCSTVAGINAAAGTACLSSTSKGVSEVAAWGGQRASYPAIPVVARGTTWDTGAYQYASAPPPAPTPAPPSPPTTWVNNNEGNTAFSYELVLGASSWLTGPPPTCSFSIPYAASTAGLQAAINAIEACRTLTGVGIALDIPAGLYTNAAANGLIIPQSNTSLATNFLILRSIQDLPNGQTVCAHGIQDNVATSLDIGIENADCAGDALSYQLGTTVTNISSGPFTLANGNTTSTSNYNDVQYMWTAECSGANCSALSFCSPLGTSSTSIPPKCTSTTIAPDHWLIEDMEARPNAGNTGNGVVVSLQQTGTETSASQLATHIHFRKDWIHGDWTSLTAGANSVSAGILLACNYCSLVDSQISQILRPGAEGHAIGAAWGGQFKIDHNWVEGGSIGYISGGFSGAPSISGLIPSTDVQFGRNTLRYPYSWLGVNDTTCGTFGVGTVPHTNAHWGCTSSSGNSLVRKNAFELKEAVRFLAYGNIFRNVDNSGGQGGIMSDFDVRNNSGSSYATGNNYQAVISDLTFTSNIWSNGCEGLEFGSSNSAIGDGGGVSFILNRALFSNNLLYNITNTNPGCTGVNSVGIYLSSGLQQWKGTITGNGTQATFVATCSVDGGDCPAGPPSVGFQVTDINPGDPISISGCSVTSFNAPTQVIGGVTVPAGVGSLAATGTNPASLTVKYPSTVNGSDLTGNCILTKGQGGPANVSIEHTTFVTDSTHAITSNNAPSGGPNFAITTNFTNSIVLGGGWFNNPVGEGTPTEKFNHDFTSMTADHLVWPTRTATLYTPYCNNTAFPCTTPVMFFPATSYCTGATPSSSCVGFVGAMSASSMPLVLPDYHNFALITGSIFKSGGTDQASDGKDQGVNLAALDAAQTENLYVGASGPFPDAYAAAPTFSPAAGTYTGAQAITLLTISPNAQIYWNTTGAPGCGTAGSTLYTGFLTVGTTETVYAIACGTLYASSSVSSASYTIKTTVATPTFNPLGETSPTTISVVITSQAGATNIYATDGSTPATSSGCTPSGTGTAAASPNTISVSVSETVKAIGCLSGSVNSAVGSASYLIQPASGNTFTITGQGVITGSGSIH
jgi:hypothetical protein